MKSAICKVQTQLAATTSAWIYQLTRRTAERARTSASTQKHVAEENVLMLLTIKGIAENATMPVILVVIAYMVSAITLKIHVYYISDYLLGDQ